MQTYLKRYIVDLLGKGKEPESINKIIINEMLHIEKQRQLEKIKRKMGYRFWEDEESLV